MQVLVAILVGTVLCCQQPDKSDSRTPDEAVVDQWRGRLVQITVSRSGATVVGTGFLYGSSNLVITAYHVVSAADEITVTRTKPPLQTRKARLVRSHYAADLAELQLLDLEPPLDDADPDVDIRESFDAKTQLTFLGHKGGKERGGWGVVITDTSSEELPALTSLLGPKGKNEIRRLGFPLLDLPVLDLASDIGDLAGGDSGAPIFDESGRLTAIVSGAMKEGTVGASFAIPASELDKLKAEKDRPVCDFAGMKGWGLSAQDSPFTEVALDAIEKWNADPSLSTLGALFEAYQSDTTAALHETLCQITRTSLETKPTNAMIWFDTTGRKGQIDEQSKTWYLPRRR